MPWSPMPKGPGAQQMGLLFLPLVPDLPQKEAGLAAEMKSVLNACEPARTTSRRGLRWGTHSEPRDHILSVDVAHSWEACPISHGTRWGPCRGAT